MRALIIMCIGILIGRMIFPKILKKYNEKFQIFATALLIFTMGIALGGNSSILQNITVMGLDSLLFCLIPTGLSVIIVYFITRKVFPDKTQKTEDI